MSALEWVGLFAIGFFMGGVAGPHRHPLPEAIVKATIRIINKTRWSSAHLRAFVVRAREQVFGRERQPLIVHFRASRSHIGGRASVGGARSTIYLPPPRADQGPGRRVGPNGLELFRITWRKP